MRVAQWAEADRARRSGGLVHQSATREEAWQPTAAQASDPPGKQMKRIWTAVLRKFVGPFPACHPQGTSPTSPPASHLLLIYFSPRSNQQSKLEPFSSRYLPHPMRGEATSHSTQFNFHEALRSKEQKQQQKPSRRLIRTGKVGEVGC